MMLALVNVSLKNVSHNTSNITFCVFDALNHKGKINASKGHLTDVSKNYIAFNWPFTSNHECTPYKNREKII